MGSIYVLLLLATALALVSHAAGMKPPAGPYTVSGNTVRDKNGNVHVFRGFARPSMEWTSRGQFITPSDIQAQAQLGANVIRFSLNQNFWLSGANGYDPNYKATLDSYIASSKAAGMDVILDLHWSNRGSLGNSAGQQEMADTYSIQFWTQVATAYKNDPAILFELYNEPHDVSCDVWKNGGAGPGFTVAGMQQLYNAVRATGAKNLVIVNGLGWGFDLRCVGQGYGISNPVNVMYCTHVYFNYAGKQNPTDWHNGFGYLAANYPLIATEFGNYDCSTPGYESFLAYMDTISMSFTAWAWWVGGCGFPSLITSWTNPGASLTAAGKLVVQKLGGGTTTVTSKPPTTTPPPTTAPSTGCVTANVHVNSLDAAWESWSWGSPQLNAVKSGGPAGLSQFILLNAQTSSSASAGAYFHKKQCWNSQDLLSLRFYAFPAGSVTAGSLKVSVHDCSSAFATLSSTITVPALTANQWNPVNINLSPALGTASYQVSGFHIEIHGVSPQIYLGGVQLAKNCPALGVTSTPVTTKPSTTAPPTTKPVTTAPPTTKPATTVPATTKATTAAPPTTKSTTTSPASSAPCAAAQVYVNALQWQSWSWGAVLPSFGVQYANRNSVKWQPMNYNALSFAKGSGGVTVTSTLQLSLFVHGGGVGGQVVRLLYYTTTASAAMQSVFLGDKITGGIPANQWAQVNLKLTDLGVPLGTVITRIAFQGWGSQAQATAYLSQIEFVCGVKSAAVADENSSKSSSSFPGWGVALIVIGSVLVAAALVAVVAVVYRKRRSAAIQEDSNGHYNAM